MDVDARVTTPHVLVLNCGSSSLKFGVFKTAPGSKQGLVSGEIASVGKGGWVFSAKDTSGREISETRGLGVQQQRLARIFQLFEDWSLPSPEAVGHRIVHGGPRLRKNCVIDGQVIKILEATVPFAPLHIPAALGAIRAAGDFFPGVQQVACFDTSFHAGMPDVARVLQIPRELEPRGVYRYGFHGLSCESIIHQLGEPPPNRLVIAHLGNGASITAVLAGKSIDTSMGMTPTGGVMMGERSGDIDPGVLLYLMRVKRLNILCG